MVSFFNNPELWNPKEKIWKHFQQTLYQDDFIELKFNCHYLSKGIYKPICLEIGRKNLYYSKRGIHQGYLSLNFTTMTVKSHGGQIRIYLSKNYNILELIMNAVDQVQLLLAKKCIQTTFDEHFLLEKTIVNENKKTMVYRGIRKSTNERLAVKAYNKEYLMKLPHGRRYLKNQIKALRMLNSQHIIQLHEIHESENAIYLITDFLDGGQLSNRMVAQLITEQNIPILMYNFLLALNQIHEKNIILRNITPDNILFKNQESQTDLIIIDFDEFQFKGSDTQKLNVTTEFTAPELLENKKIDAKCDIYSAGVILYKLVVSNDNSLGAKKNQLNFQAEQFIQAPKALQSLIKEMLRVDPKNRYSAEKCLRHRYFKNIFNPNDIMVSNTESAQNSAQYQEKYQPVSVKLLDSENFESRSSINSVSSKSGQAVSLKNIDDEKRLQFKQSKFSKFCSQMQEYYTPQNKMKDESLFKLAVTNSYLKYEQKNDNSGRKQIGERSGFIKKSNSLDV